MKKCKHTWIFDYHYVDNNGYTDSRVEETAIYHCEKCGLVKRHPVWIDAYEGEHD